jgi:arylsulfatase A-like enzyme
LITTDEQRADTLGCNGNPWVRTPNIDALAAGGVNFQRAYVQNTICIPSRACIQTGRYTHQHGVTYMENVIDDTPGLPAWEVTFMERLQAAGYHTTACGKLHMMPHKGFHEIQVCGGKGERWTKSAGLAIGLGPLGRDYAAWLEARNPGAYERMYEQRRQREWNESGHAVTNVLKLEEYVDYWAAQNTIDFVSRGHDKPFFAWCGFCGPHGPMDPPEPYDKMYPYDTMPVPQNVFYDRSGRKVQVPPERLAMIRRYCSHYHGQVTLIDDQIGRIVQALRSKNLLDDTLIILASDHGTLLWDFGYTGKCFFYEPIARVPLIVVPPGGLANAAGAARAPFGGIVEVFDIAPTVLDYAACEVPRTMAARSLRGAIEGREAGKTCAVMSFFDHQRLARGLCIRSDRYKYSQWTQGGSQNLFYDEFFDLENDPHERHNLIADPSLRDQVEAHRKMLINRMLQTPVSM